MSDSNKVSSTLDSIADRLEAKGLMREAADVDAISNTIDTLDAAVAGRVSKASIIKMISDLQDVYDMHPNVRKNIEAFEKAMMKEFGITDKELVSHDIEKSAAEVDPKVTQKTEAIKQARPFVESLKQIASKMPSELKARANKLLDDLLENFSRDIPASGMREAGADKQRS